MLSAVGAMAWTTSACRSSATGRTIGVLAVQSYVEGIGYDEEDERLLTFVAQHIADALERARAAAEIRQRNAELAIINSVQQGLAGRLEMQAMYDLVGDKIQEIFDAQVVDIGMLNREAGVLNFPYTIERGVRFPDEPMEVIGFRRMVFESKEPLLVNRDAGRLAIEAGQPAVIQGEASKSSLFVPLVSGGEVTGVISLQNLDHEDAFTDGDARLLMTVAGSLSVALENVRLFDETKRLLAETNERAAELAIINSVQEGLAAKLDTQAMYDLVGDKIQEIFDAQVVDIGVFDRGAGRIRFPYAIERGVRFPDEPMEPTGFRGKVLETRVPLVVNRDLPQVALTEGQPLALQGEPAKSALYVPLVTAGEATGVISLQNLDHEDAFTDAAVGLLSTLASSLSVALENVRLFEETKRLLAESNERAAELAIINSVQQGLAAELDMQAMYDLVGDKIVEIFDAQVFDIGVFDLAAGTVHYPYAIEKGVREAEGTYPMGQMAQLMIETRGPLLINDVDAWLHERGEKQNVISGEPSKSMLFAPLIVGAEVRGSISLQNVDRTNAFRESDERLLTTLAASLSVALENARLVGETRQRASELAIVNEVGQAAAAQLDLDQSHPADRRAAGDDVPGGHRLHRAPGPGDGHDRLPVPDRATQARAPRADEAWRGSHLADPGVEAAAAPEHGGAVRGDGSPGRWHLGQVVPRASRSWSARMLSARSASRASTRPGASAIPMPGCCRRLPPTSAPRSATPSSTGRPSVGSARPKRSTRSDGRSPRRSTSRRSCS